MDAEGDGAGTVIGDRGIYTNDQSDAESQRHYPIISCGQLDIEAYAPPSTKYSLHFTKSVQLVKIKQRFPLEPILQEAACKNYIMAEDKGI